ncbi:hypothetical protein [Egbenema bharatensis]|uniref:hypothetical protein n=1 Tax=Egbenema bharatensis TaxID=3463334 RepID=UPI003A89D0DF
MSIAHRLNFEEYLNHARSMKLPCELVDGKLVDMGLGTVRHGAIAKFLEQVFEGESDRTLY